MAIETYLRLGQIEGESTRIDYPDQIELVSWRWASGHTGGAGLASSIVVTKYTDAASPLIAALHHRRQAVDAVLTCVQSGYDRETAFHLRLSCGDVRIDAIEISCAAPEDLRPLEQLTLSLGRLKIEVQPRNFNGSPKDIVEYGFEIAAPRTTGNNA